MTEKRKFYSDAIAAAYMDKHFGIKLQRQQSAGFVNLRYAELLGAAHQKKEVAYYIHPDSLHLLEPKEGDLCLLESGCIATCKHKLNTLMLVLLGFTGLPYYDTLESHPVSRVLQRDGKLFLWPESDNATKG